MVEHAAHNGFVVGSIPTEPIFLNIIKIVYFTLKNYQILKLKNYFKTKSLFIVFHCVKLDLKEWADTEQELKKLKVNYYKFLKNILVKELKNSIYCNYHYVINGSTMFIGFEVRNNSLSHLLDLGNLQKNLKLLFIKLSLKLNNRFYLPRQLSKFKILIYKENVLRFNKVLNKILKSNYLLTSK